MTGPAETIHLVVNPAAGTRTAGEFVRTHVEALLQSVGYHTKTYETESIGDASRIAREIAASRSSEGQPATRKTVVLAGGDGTAHEFIEGLYGVEGAREAGWNLVIIPLGTANALYASTYPPGTPSPTFPSSLHDHTSQLDDEDKSKLHSLAAFLDPEAKPSRLPISLLSFNDPKSPSTAAPSSIPSHVVISTCLHSNLLASAESLRSEYPGVERFKVAAQQNAGRFYPAKVTLYPTDKGSVELFDPSSASYAPAKPSEDSASAGEVVIEDDFAYFLTSATCPRLEPTFVISPLLQRIPSGGNIDVTVLRPGRDPRIRAILSDKGYSSIRAAREAADQATLDAVSVAWVPRAWEVLTKAYDEGAHVDLTYTAEGGTESRGTGERVVEVYRCGGFEWKPSDPSDEKSHLVCADGSLIHIPPGGSASVRLDGQGPSDSGVFLCR